jgi:hypothetical protein
MPSTACPQLIPLYTAWKDSLTTMREARLRFQESGSEEDSRAFDEAVLQVKQATKEFEEVAYKTTVEYREKQVCQLDALVIGRIDELLGTGKNQESQFKVEDGRIIIVDITRNKSPFANEAVALMKYLGNLHTFIALRVPHLERISNMPESLLILDCAHTSISSISELPSQLMIFQCYDNPNLEFLPEIPPTVHTLHIQKNKSLQRIPDFPGGLYSFNCSGCEKIDSIPKLPSSLKSFNCSHMPKLRSIPDLPDGLVTFACAMNSIEKLPDLPDTLTYLDIQNTPASNDPKIQERLKAFKKAHPRAQVIF